MVVTSCAAHRQTEPDAGGVADPVGGVLGQVLLRLGAAFLGGLQQAVVAGGDPLFVAGIAISILGGMIWLAVIGATLALIGALLFLVMMLRAGFAPEYYFIEDRASDVPYYGYYTADGVEPRTRIYVEDGYARPAIREISEVSEVVRGLGRGYELHRICFPAEVKDEVYRLYHGRPSAKSSATFTAG